MKSLISRNIGSVTKVIFSVDVEDDINSISEVGLERILHIFKMRRIKASFLLTGDELRKLTGQKKHNILNMLKRHDIGYHSSHHSKHPTIPEYTRDLGWKEGLRRLKEREENDIELIQKTFGSFPSAFGSPGDVWVPYITAFCKETGIQSEVYNPVEVLGWKPCSYMGLPNFGKVSLSYDPQYHNECMRAFGLKQKTAQGIMVVRLHPSRFVQEGWWDSRYYLNSSLVPRYRIRELENNKIQKNFENLKSLLDVVCGDMNTTTFGEICADLSQDDIELTDQDVLAAANSVENGIFPLWAKGQGLSYADVLYVLLISVISYAEHEKVPQRITIDKTILGPLSGESITNDSEVVLSWKQFIAVCKDALEHINRKQTVRATIVIPECEICTGDMLKSLARLYKSLNEQRKPREVRIKPDFSWPSQIQSIFVKVFPSLWKWPVLSEGFTLPKELGLARAQAWSLKPLSLNNSTHNVTSNIPSGLRALSVQPITQAGTTRN